MLSPVAGALRRGDDRRRASSATSRSSAGACPASGFDNPGAHLALAHAQAISFKPDIQGRFLLPERLRHPAGIDRDVTVVGAGSRVEFWNPATYGLDLDEVRQNLAFVQGDIDFDLDPGAGA